MMEEGAAALPAGVSMFSTNEEEVAKFLCAYGREQLEKFFSEGISVHGMFIDIVCNSKCP